MLCPLNAWLFDQTTDLSHFYNRANGEPAWKYGFDLNQTFSGLENKRPIAQRIHFL
jgi:hypothetical protein